MRTAKQILFFISLTGNLVLYSQAHFAEAVMVPVQNDALYREKVFIHLNKSTYFTGENIWFSAYVSEDGNNIPAVYTTNLHVNLLDRKGNVVDRKDMYIENGKGAGEFPVRDSYAPGTYYIQAYTNFMENFGRENVYLQEIDIIAPNLIRGTARGNNTAAYDIQVFPESGYLLEDAVNTMGIRVLNRGKGHPFTGKIVDSKGTQVITFEGNPVGMAKCKFWYEENEAYAAVLEIDNTAHQIDVPRARSTGLIFDLDNAASDKISVTLRTNQRTIPELLKETLALMIFRNNKIAEAVTLTLIDREVTVQELFFDKEKMLHGVNEIMLFRNNHPEGKRRFFVDHPDHKTTVVVQELKRENDSIFFSIQTKGPYNNPVPSQLSISVLPSKSELFDERQHIESAFLLSPYVEGPVENPSFYLGKNDPRARNFLDLLLLNQAYKNYTLSGLLGELTPKEKVPFERGFALSGKVQNPGKNYEIGILTRQGQLAAATPVKPDNTFTFDNIYANKNDDIRLTLIQKNGPLVKPSGLSLNTPLPSKENYSYLLEQNYNYGDVEGGSEPSLETPDISGSERYPNLVELDEVTVSTAKVNEKTIEDAEMELAKNRKLIASEAYKGKKVTKQMETTYLTAFDYFRSLNYIKPTFSNEGNAYYISLRGGANTIIDLGGKANPDGSFPPSLFINDVRYSRNNSVQILRDLLMTDVDEILINKSGSGGGADGTGGSIRIYLKKGNHQYFEEGSKTRYQTLILNTGYDKPEDYFRPDYRIASEEIFRWTEVDWLPNVQTDTRGVFLLKIPANPFSDAYQLVINGFSEKGLLFHRVYDSGDPGN